MNSTLRIQRANQKVGSVAPATCHPRLLFWDGQWGGRGRYFLFGNETTVGFLSLSFAGLFITLLSLRRSSTYSRTYHSLQRIDVFHHPTTVAHPAWTLDSRVPSKNKFWITHVHGPDRPPPALRTWLSFDGQVSVRCLQSRLHRKTKSIIIIQTPCT